MVVPARVQHLDYANVHLFCLYPALVDCLCVADHPVIDLLQSALRRVGAELKLNRSA